MSELTIVIVSFNARNDLAVCLSSLRDAPPVVRHDIVVVDNASEDGSVDAARAVPGVTVIPLERNVGFAAANNVGIRATHGELILLLNSDTIVPAGAIDALVVRMRRDPTIGVVGPRLVDADGRPELSFGKMIAPEVEWRRKTLQRDIDRERGNARLWLNSETSREHFVDWVSGACLLVSRRDAERVGLLDERFFLYTEDVDFCHSIRKLGRKVLFTPVATITHLRGRSRSSHPEASRQAYRRSHVAFYEKHHPVWAPVLKLYLRMRGEL